MGLGNTELPRTAGMFHGAERGGSRASFMATDQNNVCVSLGNPGGNSADSGLGDELHSDPGTRIDLLEIVDELRQILDGVDVVVWWW